MDLSNTPALKPPNGEEPNFVDPYSTHDNLIIAASISLFVCVLSVTIRIYARTLLKHFDLTDGALLIALAFMIVFASLSISTGRYGQGRHQWDVTVADLMKLLEILNILEIFYALVTLFAKYAVLRQIEAIFYDHRRKSLGYKVLWVLIWVNIAYYVALTLSFIFACVPREKIWNPDIKGRCVDTNASIISAGLINVLSDITILLLPITAILGLNLRPKAKIGSLSVFAVGILAVISGIVRFYYSVLLTRTEDVTFALEPLAIWGHVEFATVFLVACAPLFPRFFRHMQGKAQNQSYALSDISGQQQFQKSSGTRGPSQRSMPDENDSMANLRPEPGNDDEGNGVLTNNIVVRQEIVVEDHIDRNETISRSYTRDW
ncbi:hypothetical protein F4803DRAFT_307425 [Xylaria telfairii]|nr:hypothetical protein F4803DRAFT_307425 [Xylaria telfairii]